MGSDDEPSSEAGPSSETGPSSEAGPSSTAGPSSGTTASDAGKECHTSFRLPQISIFALFILKD